MQIQVMSDIAVIEFNPEWADVSNPDGAIYGEVFYIVAETKSGRRFHGPTLGTDKTGSEKIVDAYQTLVDAKLLDPEKEWGETYPVYGSAAYVDQEPEIVFAERQADENEVPF